MQEMGEYAIVDTETGEEVGEINSGDIIISAHERQRRARMKKEREEHEINRYRGKGERYIFVNTMFDFSELSPSTVTKLIYLSTYAGYDNLLVLNAKSKKEIKRSDLPKILGVSKRTSERFWNSVKAYYIREDEETGKLWLNDEIFKRGKLKSKTAIDYQQFYFNGVRSLYKHANGKNHNYLGYLFQLIPFINREWNVVCENPFETDLDNVQLVTMKDFCAYIGYKDTSSISKLKRIYDALEFDVNGKKQRFCALTYTGLDSGTARICINPEVFYVGSNKGRVDVLKLFYKE